MPKLRLYYPVKPYVCFQKFGGCHPAVCDTYKSMGLQGHNGEDSQAVHGQMVRAAHDGTVTFAGENGSGGYGIVIRTDEKYEYKGEMTFFKSIYWHLLPGTFKVTAGQKVKAGDYIAQADNTGISTGDHLHFGLKPIFKGEQEWQWFNSEQDNGYKGAIDPRPYWTGIHAEDVQKTIGYYQTLVSLLQGMVDALKAKKK